uniref:Macro domain-containing protein n=1 Tax=Neolamprologus brichardi TaxID=32507 RepID=A0A3Q4GEN8_NEOBR
SPRCFNESGMAVVVGELSLVHARLLDIEQPSSLHDNIASLSLSEESTTIASYSLCDGLQVFVCQGDITKQHADALVNAANQDLEHSAGVAAALSRAGGPEIQRESDELVKCFGKISIGETVVTTGGNLKCKKLLHAVGPIGGKPSKRDKMLLEKTVHSALKFSEIMEFQSIAIPCISSGVSGVPLTVVKSVKPLVHNVSPSQFSHTFTHKHSLKRKKNNCLSFLVWIDTRQSFWTGTLRFPQVAFSSAHCNLEKLTLYLLPPKFL